MRTIIIGGGVAGLATALALGRAGRECMVVEQSASLPTAAPDSGAGLTLWSNAIRVLRGLGLEDKVLAAGSVIDHLVTMSGGGRNLARLDVGAIGKEAGAVSIGIRRAELRKILCDALPPGVVRAGARCVSFAVRKNAVIAHRADGSTCDGDLLLGADGIYSAVRAQLLGSDQPRYSGYTCWRGVATGDWLPARSATTVMGHGMKAGLIPCGAGQVYWFVTHNAPARATVELTSLLNGFPAQVGEAIRATPTNEILRNDIIDRPPSSKWGKGPVTLLGDAAHPSTPNFGQGACQALEDAQALSECLKEPRAGEESLRAYERLRMPRTAMLTNEAWRMGRIMQTDNAFAIGLRDLLTASPVGRHLAGNMMRQLLCR